MTGRSPLTRFPGRLSLLVLALVAVLAAALFAGQSPQSAQAQTHPIVWSATLTVDTGTDHGDLLYGCDDGRASLDNRSSSTVLTDNTLDYGAKTYTFSKFLLDTSSQGTQHRLTLNFPGSADLPPAIKETGTLVLGTQTLNFSNATSTNVGGNRAVIWNNVSQLSWTDGQALAISIRAPKPGLELSSQQLVVDESGSAGYTVRLMAKPAANVIFTATKSAGGDADLTLDTNRLIFTPSNWNTPQTVTVRAAKDRDFTNGMAEWSHTVSGTDVYTDTIGLSDAEARSQLRVTATERDVDSVDLDLNITCPTNVRAIPDTGSVTLLWDCADDDVVGYEYRMKSADAPWSNWTSTTQRDSNFHIVGGLAGGVGYTFQLRAKGTVQVDTTNTQQSRVQFVTTIPPGNQSTGTGISGGTTLISAMVFKTGSNPDGYLMSGARVMFHDFRDDDDADNDEVNDTRTTVVKLRANDDRGTTEDPEDPEEPRAIADDIPGKELYTLTRSSSETSWPLIDLANFDLSPMRILNPNTLYWITVNEGVPCNRNDKFNSTQCSAAFLNQAEYGNRKSQYGWSIEPTADARDLFRSRVFHGDWSNTGQAFEYSILGYPRRSRDVTTYGAPSAEVSATPSAPAGVTGPAIGGAAGQASGVSATIINGQVSLSWNRASGVTGYEYSYRRGGGRWTDWTRVGPDKTGVWISLDNPSDYQFRVRTVVTTYGAPVEVSPSAGATGSSQPVAVGNTCQNSGTWVAGSSGGDPFGAAAVSSIRVSGGNFVDALVINGSRYGGSGGSLSEKLVLRSGEYINCVVVRQGDFLDRLEFHTNQGRSIGGGGTGGSETLLQNIRVTHIGGRAGDFVDQITVAYCDE